MKIARIISFALVVLVALTSQQLAVARGVAKDAQGQVVLCTGHGFVTVAVNTQGEPIGPVHICPDCALTFMAVAAAPQAVARDIVHMSILGQGPERTWQNPFMHVPAAARAPPWVS